MGRDTLSAQDLDKIITIQRNGAARDSDYNTPIDSWVTVANKIHANLLDLLPSKAESQSNGIRIANRPTRVRIRFRTDITSDMRVIVHTPVYRVCKIVTMPAELGRKDGLEFMIEEYTSQGMGS